MIYIQTLGQTQSSIPPACEGYTGSRITFRGNGLRLTVPNAVEDKTIRWMMDRGKSLVEAYKAAGAGSIVPDPGIRPCISEKLRTRYFNQRTQTWELTGGQYTCVSFHECFVDYVKAQRAFPETGTSQRRLQIAPGIYSPSAAEDQCIRDKYRTFRNLTQAYNDCGAGDILPSWPGALQFISNALDTSPQTHLYEITKTAYQLFAVKPEPEPEPPPISPPPDQKEAASVLPYILIGLAFLVISR